MAEDPLIPLKRAKGAMFDEDSTGFAARKLVWIPNITESASGEKTLEGYVRSSILSQDGDKYEVEQEGNKRRHNVTEADISKVNPPKFDQSEDMAELPNLNEPAVLFNLQDRYASNLIHTYSGLFVVVINPFRKLPIYTDEVLLQYKGQRRQDRPPHIFAVADQAYRDMLQEAEDQSILCTGESGAGKTENTKKVIQYLAYIAASGKTKDTKIKKAAQVASSRRATMGMMLQNATDLERGELENQLLRANPILETFGNAATVRNDNSSRFGKFIRIHFNAPGFIMGASIETYLLEKSRVVTQGDGERTFHAFYQLLKGADKALKEELLCESLEAYNFISTDRYDLDEMEDEEEWTATNDAFRIYGMTPEESKDVWKVVAGVLAFGQLEFEDGRRGDDEATIKDDSKAQQAALLFGINSSSLVKCLTKPKIKAGFEIVHKAQSKDQVDSAVKALSKSMYEKLFLWVVQRINASLDKTKGRGAKQFIGILDIAGFEIFENNSFEQLLINFTNEKLQQLFNRRMFILEQEEYKREGIEWDFIDFGLDLQPTIDLIEGRGGLVPILDEQSIFPKATDKTLVEKYEETAKGNDCFTKKTLRMKGDFAVKHYAGQVLYDASGWLVKNKDPLNDNVVALLKDSAFPFMKTLWTGPGQVVHSARHRGAMRTVAGIYTQQLKELMDTLATTTPNFVRCIKPNHDKRPGKIVPQLVLDQLRCGGVLEGIRIVRKGFPNRVPFQDFRHRYQLLTPNAIPSGFVDSAKAAVLMLEALELDEADYRVGHTKIFFRAGVLSRLEEQRDAVLSKMIIGLQAYCRGKLARLAFRFHVGDHQAVGIIQRNVRAYMMLRQWPWWRLYCKVKPMLKELQKRQDQNAMENELKEIKEKLAAEIEARKAAEEQVAAYKDEIERLKEEVEYERESVRDLETELTKREAKIKEWEEEMEISDQKLDELMEKQSKMIKEKKDLVDEIEDLKDDLAQGNDADRARIERLEKEKAELHETMTSVEEQLAVKAKEIKGTSDEIKVHKEKIETLEAALKTAEKAKTKSQNEVEDLVNQVDELTRQAAQNARKLKTHAEAVRDEQAKTDAVTAQLNAATAELHKTQTKVIQIEAALAESTEKAEHAEKEKKQLKADLEELSARDDLEAKVNELQAKLREQQVSLDTANEEREDCEAELMKANREKTALEMKMHQLEAQKSDEELTSGPKIKKLNNQIDELHKELDVTANRNRTLFADKKRLEIQAKTLEGDLEDEKALRLKDARLIKSLNKKIAFLTAEGGEGGASQVEVDRLRAKYKEAREALEDEEDKNATLKSKARRIERDLDEKTDLVATLENEVKDLRDKVRRFKAELAVKHDVDDDDEAEA